MGHAAKLRANQEIHDPTKERPTGSHEKSTTLIAENELWPVDRPLTTTPPEHSGGVLRVSVLPTLRK